MSKTLDFYTLDSWISKEHRSYFLVESFTSTGETHSYISEMKSVTEVHNYIVTRFKEKKESIKARKVRIAKDEDTVLHFLQTTTYESYISYKLYKIYGTTDQISRLKKLIYETDFK